MKRNSNLETIVTANPKAVKLDEMPVQVGGTIKFREIDTQKEVTEIERNIERYVSGRLKIGKNMAREYLAMKQNGQTVEAEKFRYDYMFGESLRNYFETSRVAFRDYVKSNSLDDSDEFEKSYIAFGYISRGNTKASGFFGVGSLP